jgi:hypothetical protein
MDPRKNPYAPGAGTPPPELAGRDELIVRAAIALDRIRAGRAARSLILHGLRGVGKTVLLNRIETDAEARGFASVKVEAPEERSLPALLTPVLRVALLRLDRGKRMRANLARAGRALAGFAKALKVKYKDIEVSTDFEPERGLADSGDLDTDLTDLLASVGSAARDYRTGLVLFIDELQYVHEDQLASLTRALHSASQRQLPVTMLAAGLPQLIGQTVVRSPTRKGCLNSSSSIVWTTKPRTLRYRFRQQKKASLSRRRRSPKFCIIRWDTRTFFRNGADTPGMSRTHPRSRELTRGGRQFWLSRNWMPAFFGCASKD